MKEALRYYFPAEDGEGAVEERVGGGGCFGDDVDGETGRCPENGSKRFFDGQAAFRLLEAFFVKGVSHSDADCAVFREFWCAAGEGK